MPSEAKEIFEAVSESVHEMLSDHGTGFYIPPYQRPYSWDLKKVEKFLQDTIAGFSQLLESEECFTFLGTVITIHDRDFTTVQPVVRTEVPPRVLNVIDGQQRLTTLLITCVCLHNLICRFQSRLNRAHAVSADSVTWLIGQTTEVLDALQTTLAFEKRRGTTSPMYPRMIRAFVDQWSTEVRTAKYSSPIAHLISCYLKHLDKDPRVRFRPEARPGTIEGEEALVARYKQIERALGSINDLSLAPELGDLPNLSLVSGNKKFQVALLNHEFPEAVRTDLVKHDVDKRFVGFLLAVLYARFLLHRVAFTVVKGKNEDYAFSVFESLNTTGEPLTAFETFRPRVVSAETLEHYEASESRKQMDQIGDYLAGFKAGEEVQKATQELLVTFALAETGAKLSKRLPDQRRYLQDEYRRYAGDSPERLAFVRHLRCTAIFLRDAWRDSPALPELPVSSTTDVVKLCLAFLYGAKHSVVIAPILRFFSTALASTPPEQDALVRSLESAIKAVTAFSVLWRTSRIGTKNIDQEYRDLMVGDKPLAGMAPLSRKVSAAGAAKTPSVDVEPLKRELVARLSHPEKGGIGGKAEWVSRAGVVPQYANSTAVSRFLLLAAYDDAIEDPVRPGLITRGRPNVAQCLTFGSWCNQDLLTLEHVAPKADTATAWDGAIYSPDRDFVHRLGNLVLVQQAANSSLSNRSWAHKAVLYEALGATSHHDAKQILDDAAAKGITFSQSTADLVTMSSHMAHLSALGKFGHAGGTWDKAFIETRSQRLLELAWDRLSGWLYV